MIKLHVEEKFFIEGDSGLILVDEVKIDPDMIKNNYIEFKGTRFFVDYEDNNIDKAKSRVSIMISFTIEDVNEVD